MKKKMVFSFVLVVACLLSVNVMAKELTKIRIGWQIPWATQGQLVQVWKHTDILNKNGLKAEFIGRTYGPILNKIALAGEIDVILTADQPAAALFSKRKGWIGIGRLMYNRTSTYVPPNSPIKTIKDLKGKTIAIPIGAAAERVTVQALIRNGLNPKKDVKIINLGIRQQGPLVLKEKNNPSWGNIDALSGFDPTPAIFESQGLVRPLDVGKVCSLVLMNINFIKKNPEVAKKVMQSLFDAYDYYRQNIEQVNARFMEEAGLKNADQGACNIAASIEPNVWVKSRGDIRVSFINEDFAIMQSAADFLVPKVGKVEMKDYVSNKYVIGVK